MNYYEQAISWHNSAKLAHQNGFYQQAVYQCCLAIELFMKTKLSVLDDSKGFETSHDVIGIYNELSEFFDYKNRKVYENLRLSRKYFNESRYPMDVRVFTPDFAQRFLDNTEEIIEYVDGLLITEEMLAKKFNRPK